MEEARAVTTTAAASRLQMFPGDGG